MKPTRRTAGAAAVVLATLVAAPVAVALADARQNHALKEGFAASLEAPSERTIGACLDGLAADTFACDGLDLVGFVPDDEMLTYRDPLTSCAGDAALAGEPPSDPTCLLDSGLSDVWGWASPETGDEYVFFGKTNGTAFYRVTDPAEPEYLGEIPTVAGTLLWHDVKVYRDHAYIVSESVGAGVVVFDLTQLDDMDEAALPYLPIAPSNRFVPNGTDLQDTSVHNVAIDTDSGVLYLVGGNAALVAGGVCGGGLYALDLTQDLLEPPFVGCFEAEGSATRTGADGAESAEQDVVYVHDAHCTTYTGPDPDHQGRSICVGSNEEVITWVDTTDPADMFEISRLAHDGAAYAHQGWMSEDQRFYFHGDELDELYDADITSTRTYVVDMTDLGAPELAFVHQHDTVSFDHNMYTHDGLLYQSNYTAGLRVLDVASADDGALEEVAFFDTYPDDDDAPVTAFSGTWSVYPYLPSGTIAVTGIGEGLFLLQPSATSASAPDPDDDTPTPAPDPTPDPDPAPGGDPSGDRAPVAGRSLPATGGGAALLGILALAGAAAARRR